MLHLNETIKLLAAIFFVGLIKSLTLNRLFQFCNVASKAANCFINPLLSRQTITLPLKEY